MLDYGARNMPHTLLQRMYTPGVPAAAGAVSARGSTTGTSLPRNRKQYHTQPTQLKQATLQYTISGAARQQQQQRQRYPTAAPVVLCWGRASAAVQGLTAALPAASLECPGYGTPLPLPGPPGPPPPGRSSQTRLHSVAAYFSKLKGSTATNRECRECAELVGGWSPVPAAAGVSVPAPGGRHAS